MLTFDTRALELIRSGIESDPRAQVNVEFPISNATGAEHSAVVYFEIEPGDRLPSHTDSAEEILYIVAGEAEATVGDEVGLVSAGDLALIPAMAPHALRNVGSETVKVVGFFAGETVTSTFEEPLLPIGSEVVHIGNVSEQVGA
jgi:quercetin dioxygenase-like cupin family protein